MSHRWFASCHRYPKTTQERRHNEGNFIDVLWDDFNPHEVYDYWCHPDEGLVLHRIRVRAKRRRLPNAWDDLMRGDIDHRSWKRHRRSRWRKDVS